ncbi:phosphoribosylglycinamide formyltransferase [bacterium]|nr:phosphoribosylglycinamide formyltransferase [bacterium]
MSKLPIGILISGRGSNMQALVNACAADDYPARVALVISNKADAAGLVWAQAKGIATAVIAHGDFPTRETFDAAMTERLEQAGVKLVCLAGFMRLLTPGFVEHWQNRLINIHPSLLPAFKGLHTHEAALKAGVKEHGCTVHLVTAELDSGPILAQASVPVLEGDTPETLAARVLEQEHRIYPEALKTLIETANRPV